MIRIFRSGPHAHRTPLSYPALAPLFAGHIEEVGDPSQADLYLFAHMLDIQDAPLALVEDWRARRRPVVLLSEEPFWDTIWTRRPLDPLIFLDTEFGTLPVHQLTHATSDIFDFDRLPYYLLTHHRFANAYGHRFARSAARRPRDWQAALDTRPVDLCFMFERRPEPFHAVGWPEAGITGLCSWRTELAEACTGPAVERLGRTWQGGASRLELATDWHLDKLMRLDGRARMIGAVENTHQPNYLTEKLFDAFACGAQPVYVAAPGHRLHALGLPPEAWINLWDLSPEEAAERLGQHRAGPAECDALHAAHVRLADLMGTASNWLHERTRLAQSVLQALETVLANGTPRASAVIARN